MSELSQRSGVPVATLKYYLREGLLPAGERRGPNQASYGEDHLARLRLVRALVEVGQVSITGIRELVGALEDGTELGPLLGIAQRLVTAGGEGAPAPELAAMAALTGVAVDGPCRLGVELAGRAVHAMTQADRAPSRAWLEQYREAARLMAEADLAEVEARQGGTERARLVVVGTPLGDLLAAGLRRVAQSEAAMRRYPAGPAPRVGPGPHRGEGQP